MQYHICDMQYHMIVHEHLFKSVTCYVAESNNYMHICGYSI
jgi:hypothetical protein